MQQIGSSELAKYLYNKHVWLKAAVKKYPLPDAFQAPHINPNTPIKEAAQQVALVLQDPKGLVLMRQSMYRGTKNIPIPHECHAYSFYDDIHPLLFINAQQSLDEQTQLLFIGIIRLMMSMDGFFSSIFDSSIKESYAEQIYYEVRDIIGSEEFLQPVRTDDPFYEREDALGEVFFKAVRDAVYRGRLNNKDAAELIDVSERVLISIFP